MGTAPFLTGRGWGWVGFGSQQSTQCASFPAHRIKDPPTSPPHEGRGCRGGSAVGRLAHGLPSERAAQPRAARHSHPPHHEHRRLCERRDTKQAEGQRLARRSSRCEHFRLLCSAARHRAWRVDGVAIWPVRTTTAQRRERTSVSSPSGRVHAQREGIKARDPRTRERAASMNAGKASLIGLLSIAMKAQP